MRFLILATLFAGLLTAQTNKQQVMIATGSNLTCGNTGANNNGTNSGNANLALLNNSCVPTKNVTVNSCAVFLGDAGGHGIACAVYAPGTTPPGAPLCASSGQTSVTGWNVMILTGCGTLTSGSRYWIAANTDSGTTAYGRTSTGVLDTNSLLGGATYPAFPTAPSSGLGSAGLMFYLNVK